MNPVFVLLRKELLNFTRHKSAVFITFAVPIILIYIFSFVFGLNKTDKPTRSGIPVAFVSQTDAPGAKTLLEALKKEKGLKIFEQTKNADGSLRLLTEQEVRAQIEDNQYRFALILPPDFTSSKRLGVRIIFLTDPRNEVESQMVNGLVQKTIFMNAPSLLSKSLMNNAKDFLGAESFDDFNRSMADVLGKHFNLDREKAYQSMSSGDYLLSGPKEKKAEPRDLSLRRLDAPAVKTVEAPAANVAVKSVPAEPAAKTTPVTEEESTEDSGLSDVMASIVKFDTEQVVGKDVKNPNASRLVGGYAVMFLLFAVTGYSSGFFEEKRSGIFHRVLSTGARRHHVLWAKYLHCVLLGIGQITSLFLFGNWMFDLELGRHLLPLYTVILAASLACASFGMLIASVSANEQAANGLSTLLVITMSAIGGAWFPVTMMPDFIQQVAHFTVVYWAVEGFASVLWAGKGLLGILPNVGALLFMAALCQGFALWRFRRGSLFD